jgi:PKD repeat protein
MATPRENQIDWMPDQGEHLAVYLPRVVINYRLATGMEETGPIEPPVITDLTVTLTLGWDGITKTVDWGDGTVEDVTGTVATHTYAAAGTYDVLVTAEGSTLFDAPVTVTAPVGG